MCVFFGDSLDQGHVFKGKIWLPRFILHPGLFLGMGQQGRHGCAIFPCISLARNSPVLSLGSSSFTASKPKHIFPCCIELLDCNELLVAGNRLQELFFSRQWVNYFERYNQQWLGKSCFGAPNTAIVSHGKTKSLHQSFSNIAWQPIPIVYDKYSLENEHGTKTP